MLNEPNNINFVVKCYVTGEDCYCCLKCVHIPSSQMTLYTA